MCVAQELVQPDSQLPSREMESLTQERLYLVTKESVASTNLIKCRATIKLF